ncbi:MAG: succinate dehydrogenase cytochrome b subunit [Bacteroidota bacterium]|nr:succinate dehydrogenase cytochrome b subunit [Bacteroidota bacterium]
MSVFIKSSIGKKLLVSISGLFLIMFLFVHLTANLFILGGPDAYNLATHFMNTNPIIQIMQPILALGFIVHILWALIVQIKNWMSRPVKYNKFNQSESSTWVSRNMIYLGIVIFIFLSVHLYNFFWKMKFSGSELYTEIDVHGVMMHNAYALVAGLFEIDIFTGSHFIFSGLYIVGFIALGLHLYHAFWSAFQTIGWSNDKWRVRLTNIGSVVAVVIAAGFSIIPLYFLLF